MLRENRPSFKSLIDLAMKRGVLNDQEGQILHELRRYRNYTLHSKLNELSKGIILRQQEAILSEKGLIPASDWQEIKPEDEVMKDVASSLSAESRVANILLNVDKVLCRVYDGSLKEDF